MSSHGRLTVSARGIRQPQPLSPGPAWLAPAAPPDPPVVAPPAPVVPVVPPPVVAPPVGQTPASDVAPPQASSVRQSLPAQSHVLAARPVHPGGTPLTSFNRMIGASEQGADVKFASGAKPMYEGSPACWESTQT